MRPLSVVHIDTSMEWRGGQQQVLYLAEEMARLGHQVAVATPKGSALSERLSSAVRQIHIGAGWSVASLRTFRSIANTEQVDVFACHTAVAHSLLVLLGLSPVVHRRVDFSVGGNAWSRWKYAKAGHYIAVSGGVRRVLESAGVPADQIDVVFDGVPDCTADAPASDLATEKPLVGAVGALVAHKAHHLLVSAMADLPDVDCVIVGEGPLRGDLEKQIQNLGLEQRVRLLGFREDAAAVIAALDLFVHPSVEEGMGQVVVEAMRLRCPVLVSSAGGLPEVVGVTSTPFRSGDSAALASEIQVRLETPGDVQAAFVRAQTVFSVEKMVANTVEVYQRLAGA